MAAYNIFFKKSVWKDFEKITKEDLERILTRIKMLSKCTPVLQSVKN